MDIKNIILHLSLIEGIGPASIKKLVELIKIENISNIYLFTKQDFIRFGINEQKAKILFEGLQDKLIVKKELDIIKQAQNVNWITLWCDQYPNKLKHIDVPPIILYFQGDVSLFLQEKLLACVGSRLANNYVQDCLNKIVAPLIENDWIIVSGGAIGADTFAHKTALLLGGKTIVVVGSGLCHQYPLINKTLFKEIIYSGGLIVSSFPMETEPLPHCFPIRNRIVSGLSVGCIVLQAAIKSGALITAQYALDQGREVFAIPGPIYDPLSAGCHELIKLGAKLVTQSQDILDELSQELRPIKNKQETFIQKTNLQRKDNVKNTNYIVCDENERLILQHTTNSISVDELSKKTGITGQILQDKLFIMNLDGKIQQDFIGYWKRA